jgi:hypothetical protein
VRFATFINNIGANKMDIYFLKRRIFSLASIFYAKTEHIGGKTSSASESLYDMISLRSYCFIHVCTGVILVNRSNVWVFNYTYLIFY